MVNKCSLRRRTTALLFPDLGLESPPAIEGLVYIPDYVTLADEERLIAAVDAQPWDTSWERRRQLYGADYGNKRGPGRRLPEWAEALVERMWHDGFSDRPFDQLLVNEYLPGQGIALHRDYEPFDRSVVSLSLLAGCVMDFRRSADGRRE